MSYPFGSGMPQLNNSSPYPNQGQPTFGSGFPNQGMYPNQQQAPYPSNPGYPNQSGYSAQPPYPNDAPYPQQSSMPFGAGFPPMPPSQANSYPSMPPTHTGGAYPPSLTGGAYPPSHTGGAYPPSQQYPSQSGFQSNYPSTQSTAMMPGLPPASQSFYPTPSSTNNMYPSQTQYPPQSNQTSFAPSQGYPSLQNSGYQAPSPHIAATHMAACFSEMQSHKRETHSKANKPALIVHKIWGEIKVDVRLRRSIDLFSTRLLTDKLGITECGMVNLNLGAIKLLVSTMVSYSVILIQFELKERANLIKQ